MGGPSGRREPGSWPTCLPAASPVTSRVLCARGVSSRSLCPGSEPGGGERGRVALCPLPTTPVPAADLALRVPVMAVGLLAAWVLRPPRRRLGPRAGLGQQLQSRTDLKLLPQATPRPACRPVTPSSPDGREGPC